MKFSWMKKDMDKLQAKLMDEGYTVEKESSRELIRGGSKIKKEDYLTITSENLRGTFYPLQGYLQIRGETVGPKDADLIQLYKSEYRFPAPWWFPIYIGGIIGGLTLYYNLIFKL